MPKIAKIFIAIVSAIFLFLIIFSLLMFFPVKSTIDKTYSGYEIDLTDPSYAQSCEVSISGIYEHYIVSSKGLGKHDSFDGDVVLPEPYASEVAGLETDTSPLLDGCCIWLSYSNWHDFYRREFISRWIGNMYIRGKFDSFVMAMIDLEESAYSGKMIVAPASTPEEAWTLYQEYLADEKYQELSHITANFDNDN